MADVAATSSCKKRPQDGGDQRQADGKLRFHKRPSRFKLVAACKYHEEEELEQLFKL